MDSLESILQSGPPKNVRQCGVGKWLSTLPSETQEAFEAAFAKDSGWTGTALHKLMQDRGLKRNADRVRIHRRKECSCYA